MYDKILLPLASSTPSGKVRFLRVSVSWFSLPLYVPLTQSKPRSGAVRDQSRRTRPVSTVSNSQWTSKLLSKLKRNGTGLFIRDIVHLHLKGLRPGQMTRVITSKTHFSLHTYHIVAGKGSTSAALMCHVSKLHVNP